MNSEPDRWDLGVLALRLRMKMKAEGIEESDMDDITLVHTTLVAAGRRADYVGVPGTIEATTQTKWRWTGKATRFEPVAREILEVLVHPEVAGWIRLLAGTPTTLRSNALPGSFADVFDNLDDSEDENVNVALAGAFEEWCVEHGLREVDLAWCLMLGVPGWISDQNRAFEIAQLIGIEVYVMALGSLDDSTTFGRTKIGRKGAG